MCFTKVFRKKYSWFWWYEMFGDRIVSFFKDEPIVGGYIYSFYLIVLGFFVFLNLKIKKI